MELLGHEVLTQEMLCLYVPTMRDLTDNVCNSMELNFHIKLLLNYYILHIIILYCPYAHYAVHAMLG